MKRFISVFLLILVIMSASCGKAESNGGENEESKILYTNLTDFLTEEQIAVYNKAKEIFPLFSGMSEGVEYLHLSLEGASVDEIIEYTVSLGEATLLDHNGNSYIMSRGEYRTMEELKNLCLSVFTEEYFDRLNRTILKEPAFLEENGRLYYINAVKGGAFGYSPDEIPDTYELVSKSENEIRFNMIGHYKSSNVDPDYTVSEKSFPIVMTLTDNGWRFSRFAIAVLSE
ncbi:MAG: hypothetical protein IKK94_09205 [Clostridia bacterium]|nr:hypothetical protein [Clostridia bacterium]